jgi:hypothetical protein
LFISLVGICHTSAPYNKMLWIIAWEIYNFLFFVISLCHQIEFKAFIRGLLEKYPTVFFYANPWWIII